MRLLLGIILGFALGSAVTAGAQFWSSDDGRGNQTSGITDQFGNSMYNDNKGHSGFLYQVPPSVNVAPRNPC